MSETLFDSLFEPSPALVADDRVRHTDALTLFDSLRSVGRRIRRATRAGDGWKGGAPIGRHAYRSNRLESPPAGELLRYSLSLSLDGGGGKRAQVQNSGLIAQRGNKSSNQRISLNGSQCGGCST